MKYVISVLAIIFYSLNTHVVLADGLREQLLKKYALEAGLKPPEEMLSDISPTKSSIGSLLFESKLLSVNNDISCQTCHLEKFGTSDGLPLGIGTGGKGDGIQRIAGGGDILPRNTLPFWGRGAKGFNVFFWDGKVDGSDGVIHSQFSDKSPSNDPLAVAVHLPIVEIREMVPDSSEIDYLKTESKDSADQIYNMVVERVRNDQDLTKGITESFSISKTEIKISHIVESIAEFIRDRFQIRETRFHDFVFNDANLDDQEIAGGLIFYGKGQCTTCHNGPLFSDLSFHAIPFGQLGFGKNGFGVDYGRFNVTLNPDDLYKFRTPPLYNVNQTAPYSHSGSMYDLGDTIRAHLDPLSVLNIKEMSKIQRVEFYKMLRAWASESAYEVFLDENEIQSLVAFLSTLSFSLDPLED